MGFFNRYKDVVKARGTNTYKEMMKSTDRIAAATCTLIARKPVEQQEQILARANALVEKLHDVLDHETPLVVGITLFTALHALDQTLQNSADESRAG
jgi:hypothetical protein